MNNLKKFYDHNCYRINVSDLCKACNISRATFYKILNQEVDPKISTAYKIYRYLYLRHGLKTSLVDTFLSEVAVNNNEFL